MNNIVRATLVADAVQRARIEALQTAFASVCNALAVTVQKTNCWSRVGLHHLMYKELRERFPQMGSQMICNAIYSVSRTSRRIFQHPDSPWAVQRRPLTPLPLLQFSPSAPVYFDRHTVSLKNQTLSMYTLDGRMRFQIGLSLPDRTRFVAEKLSEVVLLNAPAGFELVFLFSPEGDAPLDKSAADAEMPEYVVILPPPPAHELAHGPIPLALVHEPVPMTPATLTPLSETVHVP